MYVPPHFAPPGTEALHGLIEENPFGILVRSGEGGLDAGHIPFLLDKDHGAFGRLHCHVARANPIWKTSGDGDTVLVIFQTAEAYISPNWYPSTHEHHRHVPTWNYMVAHAHGRITARDDERHLRGVVGRLAKIHEAAQPRPWKMGDSPQAFIDQMLASIVALDIEITRLIGKFKLGQNRERRDVLGAADALRVQGNKAIADAMLKRLAERSDDAAS